MARSSITTWQIPDDVAKEGKKLKFLLIKGGVKRLPPAARKVVEDAWGEGKPTSHGLLTKVAFMVLRDLIEDAPALEKGKHVEDET